jgi:hypothetical protein
LDHASTIHVYGLQSQLAASTILVSCPHHRLHLPFYYFASCLRRHPLLPFDHLVFCLRHYLCLLSYHLLFGHSLAETGDSTVA